MNAIVISGYYGFGNTGDEAMLRATLQGLERRLGPLRATVVTGRPDEVRRVHGVEAVGRLDFPAVARSLRGADLFLSGGGSLLQDSTSWRNLMYHLLLFRMARQAGTRAMIYAQGVGPIRTRLGRWLTPTVIRGLSAITVRDPGSAEELRALGVTNPEAEVTADPAFALDPAPPDRIDEIWHQAGLDRDRQPVIALAPRGLRNRAAEAEGLAFAADWIVRRLKVRPLLLPMQYPNDIDACGLILQRMRHSSEAVLLEDPLAPEEILGVTGRCELVIGVRLHALIFGAAMGVPLLGIHYDPKVTYFLRRLGLEPATSIAGLPGGKEDLILGLERAWHDRALLREHLRGLVPELRALAERNFDVAAAVAQGEP